MSELPSPPPTWRRVLRLPRALGDELRWRVDLRVRRWRVRQRTGTPARWPQPLRRAWMRTDPHAMARVFEGLRSCAPSAPPPRPSVGARADYRGVLTAGWRGDLRIGDADLEDWLATELGGHIGQDGVRVDLSVRVVADRHEDDDAESGSRAGESPADGANPGPADGGRPARGATRAITVEEYHRLGEIGVLGEKVELIDGRIVFGRCPWVWSYEQLAVARAAGIELVDDDIGPASP